MISRRHRTREWRPVCDLTLPKHLFGPSYHDCTRSYRGNTVWMRCRCPCHIRSAAADPVQLNFQGEARDHGEEHLPRSGVQRKTHTPSSLSPGSLSLMGEKDGNGKSATRDAGPLGATTSAGSSGEMKGDETDLGHTQVLIPATYPAHLSALISLRTILRHRSSIQFDSSHRWCLRSRLILLIFITAIAPTLIDRLERLKCSSAQVPKCPSLSYKYQLLLTPSVCLPNYIVRPSALRSRT
jgi:hypothetical protein